MKMKWKKFLSIASLSTLLVGTVASSSAIIVSCSNNDESKNSTPPSTQNPPSNNGTNNPQVNNYTNVQDLKITTSPLDCFNNQLGNSSVEPWTSLNANPNDKIYDSIFNKINNSTILNDLKILLKNINDKQQDVVCNFDLNSINVTSGYNAQIKFKIKNFNSITRTISFDFLTDTNNKKFSFNLDPNQEKEVNLNLVNSQVSRSFYVKKIDLNSKDATLYANYKLSNVSVSVDKEAPQTFNDVSFDKYSKTLNTIVMYVNDQLCQTSSIVKQRAKTYLDSLDIKTIQEDIINKITGIVNLVKNNIDSIQNILKSLAKNSNLATFLNENSDGFASLIVNLINIPGIDLSNIKPIIASIFKNETLQQIITNNKTSIDQLINMLPESFQSIAKQVVDFINSPTVFDTIQKMLDQEPLKSLLGQTFINNIPNLKTEGLLVFLCNNFQTFKNLILKFAPSLKNVVNAISPLVLIITSNFNSNKGMIDVLIELIKSGDLKNILQGLIKNPAIMKVLDFVIFNNKNLNSANLIKIINVLAQPYSDSKATNPIQYSQWLNNVTITPTFAPSNSYNASTHKADIKLSLKFTFGSDLYLKIGDLLSILPNISLGGVVSTATIIKALPKVIGFISGDYITFNMDNTNVTLNYNVKAKGNKNYLVWNMASNNYIDINLPNSLKNIYDQSGSIVVINLKNIFKDLLKNLFYHYFNDQSVFESSVIVDQTTNIIKNPEIQGSYNYNSYNNEAVLENLKITPIEKQALKQEIISKCVNKDIPNTDFILKSNKNPSKSIKIIKTYTSCSYSTPTSPNPLNADIEMFNTYVKASSATSSTIEPLSITIDNEYKVNDGNTLFIKPKMKFNISLPEQQKVTYQWKYKSFLSDKNITNQNKEDLNMQLNSSWNGYSIFLEAIYQGKTYKSNIAKIIVEPKVSTPSTTPPSTGNPTPAPSIIIDLPTSSYNLNEKDKLSIIPKIDIKNIATADQANITYQWQKSTDNGVNWTNISNQTNKDLNIASIDTSFNNSQIRLEATYNTNKYISTNVAIITVNALPTALKTPDINIINEVQPPKTATDIVNLYQTNPKDPLFTKITSYLNTKKNEIFVNIPSNATIEITSIGTASENWLKNVGLTIKNAQLANNQIGNLNVNVNLLVSSPNIESLFDLSNYTGKYTYAIEVNQILPSTKVLSLPPISTPDIYIIKLKIFTEYNVYGPLSAINNKPTNMIEITL